MVFQPACLISSDDLEMSESEWTNAQIFSWLNRNPTVGRVVGRRANTALNRPAEAIRLGRILLRLEQALRRVWINMTGRVGGRRNTTINVDARISRWAEKGRARVRRDRAVGRVVDGGRQSIVEQLMDREVGQYRRRPHSEREYG